MPTEKNVYKEKVTHRGYFNFREVYNFVHEWFKDENYDVIEKEYKEKMVQVGKDVEIKWDCFKKLTDYFRNLIKLRWEIRNMVEVEVEKDGKKVKMNKGEIKITFEAILESDYERRWENSPLWKFMRGLYDEYVIRLTKEEYEDKLFDKTVSIVENSKAFLTMEGKR